MPKINEELIQELIDMHCGSGRMGHVEFRKADDSIRKMSFIKVPDKHIKGTGNGQSPASRAQAGLIMVYDIKARGIRSFKASRVLSLSVGGQKYIR